MLKEDKLLKQKVFESKLAAIAIKNKTLAALIRNLDELSDEDLKRFANYSSQYLRIKGDRKQAIAYLKICLEHQNPYKYADKWIEEKLLKHPALTPATLAEMYLKYRGQDCHLKPVIQLIARKVKNRLFKRAKKGDKKCLRN